MEKGLGAGGTDGIMRRALLIGQDLVVRQIMGSVSAADDAEIVKDVFGNDVILRYYNDVFSGDGAEMGGDERRGGRIEMADLQGNIAGNQIRQRAQEGERSIAWRMVW